MFNFPYLQEPSEAQKMLDNYYSGMLQGPEEEAYLQQMPEYMLMNPADFFASINSADLLQAFEQTYKDFSGDFNQLLSVPFDYCMPLPQDFEVKTGEPRTAVVLPARNIGTLTVEERAEKLKKYKEKKSRRTYTKKISYLCRKMVADNRVRVKGRFVKKTN